MKQAVLQGGGILTRRRHRRPGGGLADLGVVVALKVEGVIEGAAIAQVVEQAVDSVLCMVVHILLLDALHRAAQPQVDDALAACRGLEAFVARHT